MKWTADRFFGAAFVAFTLLVVVKPFVPVRYMKKAPGYQREAGIVYRAVRGEAVSVDELAHLHRRQGDKALAAALADRGVTQAELDRFFQDPRWWNVQVR